MEEGANRELNDITPSVDSTVPRGHNSSSHEKSLKQNHVVNLIRSDESSVPITLTWNVSAYVEAKNENFIKRSFAKRKVASDEQADGKLQALPIQANNIKYILKQVTGIVKPGSLCAIMGASGSGKTTLLNVLNFRNSNLLVEGAVKMNGKTISWRDLSRYSAYVQQDDVYIATLTVKEHLTFLVIIYMILVVAASLSVFIDIIELDFKAVLKMDKSLPRSAKDARVEEVMTDLNLIHIEDTIIGVGDRLKGSEGGISGGEKRRLAFASEILTNPQLLFCDEPTTGLDSFLALTVVESMLFLARKGKTVISTIHQPSSQIFESFDTLCLLAEGRVAWMGPSKDAIHFFQSVGHPVPKLYNPSDHYINTLSVRSTDRERTLDNLNRICDNFHSSSYNQKVSTDIGLADQIVSDNQLSDKEFDAERPSFFTQLYWLFWREFINGRREPMTTKAMIGQTIIIGIFFGLIYLQTKKDEQSEQNLNGLIYILLMQISFGYVVPVINTFPNELEVFYREIKNRVYSMSPYYISKLFADTPKFCAFIILLYMFCQLIWITIVYWMANILNDGVVYLKFIGLYILASQVAVGLGMVLSIVAPNAEIATALAPAILLPLIVFGGFFLNNSSTPVYFVWIKYISWLYYTYDALLTTLWSSVHNVTCSTPLLSFTLANSTVIQCPNSRCFTDGQVVINQYGVGNLSLDIGILITLFVVPRFLGLIFLKLKVVRL